MVALKVQNFVIAPVLTWVLDINDVFFLRDDARAQRVLSLYFVSHRFVHLSHYVIDIFHGVVDVRIGFYSEPLEGDRALETEFGGHNGSDKVLVHSPLLSPKI